jgi:hypothetical protein
VRLAVLTVPSLLALAVPLAACVVVHRPVGGGPPPTAAPAPDFARKPGSVPATAPASDGDRAPVAWTAQRYVDAPRLDVHAGPFFFDGATDLEDAAYAGLRAAWPTGRGFDVEVPVKVVFATREAFVPPPPSSTGPGTAVEEDGVVVFVEPGVRVRRTWGQVEGSLGLGAGAAFFTGFGDDDTALSVQASATLAAFLSNRFAVFLEVQGHAVFTDVGGGDRALRPAGAVGLGLSWDL